MPRKSRKLILATGAWCLRNKRKTMFEKLKQKASAMSASDWHELEEYLDEFFSGFMTCLRHTHPDLREKDYRYCMLLKLGLTNSELAAFYCISMPAVKQRLLRLKKRLSLASGDVAAREYIVSLF